MTPIVTARTVIDLPAARSSPTDRQRQREPGPGEMPERCSTGVPNGTAGRGRRLNQPGVRQYPFMAWRQVRTA